VHVVQGERPMVADNKSLGKVELHGLPPAPRGVPEIEVTFELDANGIMHVRAKDLGTGRAQTLRIVSSSGLSEAEVEEMVRQAELYRGDDERRQLTAATRNQLDGLLYNTQRSYEEYGAELSAAARAEVEDALRTAEDSLDSGDLDLISAAHDRLFNAAQLLAEAIYGDIRDQLDAEAAGGASDDELLDDQG
jgi:molecular chaperone DnaK